MSRTLADWASNPPEKCDYCGTSLGCMSECCFEADDLRAGITRAESDLAEARDVARKLKALTEFIDGREYDKFCEARALGEAHPWLSETD